MSAYRESLIKTVIDNSSSDFWDSAVTEWKIEDCIEDEHHEFSCICGKENLRYLFTIRNVVNGYVLHPIGSSCIKKFGRVDLNEQATVIEKLFQLMHAIEERRYISLNSTFFSRKLLKFLYEDGAFVDNQYNHFDCERDYLFMLDMFNKRNRPTERQEAKIRGIIVSSIKPYLIERLESKHI